MSPIFLRVLIWVVSVLALLGNAAVLLVLLGKEEQLHAPPPDTQPLLFPQGAAPS